MQLFSRSGFTQRSGLKCSCDRQVRAGIEVYGIDAAQSAVVDDGFFSDSDDELDLDYPSEGFSSIREAIEDVRRGKVWLINYLIKRIATRSGAV